MRVLKWSRMFVAVLAMTLTVVTACDSAVDDRLALETTSVPRWPATDFYEVPDQLRDATMVWSAEPGIDLLSAEGTLVRASEESFAIGLMIGLDYTYLGFADNSNSRGGGGLFGGFEDDTGEGPFAGTIHGHIQQIIPTEVGFDVLSCVLAVGLDKLVDGRFVPSRITEGDGGEQRSRFIRTGVLKSGPSSSPSVPASDRPNWQAPTGNEFRGWEIDGFVDIDPITSGTGRCVPWARSLYPDAPTVIPRDAYARATPPPVQPAHPGWPDGSN